MMPWFSGSGICTISNYKYKEGAVDKMILSQPLLLRFVCLCRDGTFFLPENQGLGRNDMFPIIG